MALGGFGGGVIGSAVVRLVLDNSQLNAGLAQSQAATQKATTQMGASTSRFAGLSQTAYLAAGAAVVAFVAKGVKEFIALDKVQRQTASALHDTAGEANVTAEQIRSLAVELEDLSSVDEIAIQQGENLLLTFRNIRNEAGAGNDIFNQATKAFLNLSIAMGKDTAPSAIMVGKALNDPIKGMTALQKAGVTLTDEQKELVKSFVNTGRVMEAQKVILGEMHKEFGTAAKAYGESFEGRLRKLGDTFSDLARDIVGDVIPAFEQVMEFAGPIVDWLAGLVGWVFKSEVAFTGLLFAINPILGALKLLTDVRHDGFSGRSDSSQIGGSERQGIREDPRTLGPKRGEGGGACRTNQRPPHWGNRRPHRRSDPTRKTHGLRHQNQRYGP